ncbi:MAG: Panacea domain-containing protein [Candidatus Pacebacteria bacterium]|nr:Panacea domain-containing protein [Candidatus Paceibacterota bacterium]
MDQKKIEKYKNAILYFAKNLTQQQLGKTKLAKLLYYLDFISYRDNEKNVTGALYYKQEHGPLAQDLTEMIGNLVSEKKLEVNRVIVGENDKQKDQFKALKDPDENVFDVYEQTLLRKLINKYANTPTDVIVAKSHLEAPWVKATNGASLDYKFAFDIEDFDPEIEAEAKDEDEKVADAVKKEMAKAN